MAITVVSGSGPRGSDRIPSRIEFGGETPFPLAGLPLGIRLLTFHNLIVLSKKVNQDAQVTDITIGAKQKRAIPKGPMPLNMINFFFNF